MPDGDGWSRRSVLAALGFTSVGSVSAAAWITHYVSEHSRDLRGDRSHDQREDGYGTTTWDGGDATPDRTDQWDGGDATQGDSGDTTWDGGDATPDDDQTTWDGEDAPPGTDTDRHTETPVDPYVDSIEMYDLPNRWETGREFEVSAMVEGYNLESVRILARRHGTIETNVIAEEEINEEGWAEYEITTDDYEVENTGQVDYWAIAEAGHDEEMSEKEAVEFFS
jgi:hypothetical protein